MLWHAMPPELNTARLMAGAGPAPMLAAAAGWQTLSAALDAQAVELTARLNSLGEAWTGGGSDKALAAATPMVVWLQTASTQAKTRAMQATAQAAAYTQAMATTPSLPEIAANHITQAVLTATNFRYQHDPDRVDRDGLFHPYVEPGSPGNGGLPGRDRG